MIRKALLISLISLTSAYAGANEIKGAGSSAAAPLYQTWADAYAKTTASKIDYQAIGSSAGIRKIKNNELDFGASDVALPSAELKKAKLIQFPSAVSGVAIIYHVPGLRSGELKLNSTLLSQIFSKKIQLWNDQAIQNLNPGLRLPAHTIEVIARQDGSGSTYNFSDYLSKANPDWQNQYGKNFTIQWNENVQQVKGSSLLAAKLKKTPYAISYVDYNYVAQEKLDVAQLQNREGKFVLPNAESFSSALSNSSWKTSGNFEEALTDKAGTKSWPITMGTFVIMSQAAVNTEKAKATLRYFNWAFLNGDRLVNSVDFVRLPDALQARVFREMTTVTDQKGVPLNWSV